MGLELVLIALRLLGLAVPDKADTLELPPHTTTTLLPGMVVCTRAVLRIIKRILGHVMCVATALRNCGFMN